jgi:uncharacterized protein (DUF488 family)
MRSEPGSDSEAPFLILTVGHSTHSAEEFIALLQAHDVDMIVDVRKMPGSRRHPHFNSEALQQSLRVAGIGYIHLAGLGGLRPRLPESPNAGWKNASFRAYADYMLTPGFQESLNQMLEQTRGIRPALMCAEAVPWRCHRSLIADALVVRNIRVEHIMTPAQKQPHVLRSWAKVEGTQITYPVPEEQQPDFLPE